LSDDNPKTRRNDTVLLTPKNVYPVTIAAGATYDTGFVPVTNLNAFLAGVKMDQAGTLDLDRYLDSGGLVEIGSPLTVGIVANTAVTLDVEDGKPCQFVRMRVVNTSGVLTNVAAIGLLGGNH
jgi:hypothetical protein